MERYGRKGTAVYIRWVKTLKDSNSACFHDNLLSSQSSSIGAIGALFMLAAKWFDLAELFMVGHFLAGVVNMLKIVVSIYFAECAPNSARGSAKCLI